MIDYDDHDENNDYNHAKSPPVAESASSLSFSLSSHDDSV